MDLEMLTLEYADAAGLIADLRAALEAAGAFASIEVIYGHAWKGAPRKSADGRSIVHFERRPVP